MFTHQVPPVPQPPTQSLWKEGGAYLGSGGREGVAPAAFLPGDAHCPSTELAPSTSWTQHSSSALAEAAEGHLQAAPWRAAHLGPGCGLADKKQPFTTAKAFGLRTPLLTVWVHCPPCVGAEPGATHLLSCCSAYQALTHREKAPKAPHSPSKTPSRSLSSMACKTAPSCRPCAATTGGWHGGQRLCSPTWRGQVQPHLCPHPPPIFWWRWGWPVAMTLKG